MTETADWPEEPAERVRELVEGVLDELDLDGEVEIEEDDERIAVTVEGEDDYGLLIGKRGPDDRRPAAALLPGRLPRHARAQAGRASTPPATASAAARPSRAAPTGPPSRR